MNPVSSLSFFSYPTLLGGLSQLINRSLLWFYSVSLGYLTFTRLTYSSLDFSGQSFQCINILYNNIHKIQLWRQQNLHFKLKFLARFKLLLKIPRIDRASSSLWHVKARRRHKTLFFIVFLMLPLTTSCCQAWE